MNKMTRLAIGMMPVLMLFSAYADWRTEACGAGLTPCSVKVAVGERDAILRTVRDELGLRRVQMSRPTWIATNANERVADVQYKSADGLSCHAGVVVGREVLFSGYWTGEVLCGEEGSQSRALAIVTNAVPRGCSGSAIYSVHVTVGSSSVVGAQSGRVIPIPYDSCDLFFIDDAPYANWGHPARVAFIGDDRRSVAVVTVNEPIVVSENGVPVKLKTEVKPSLCEKPAGAAKLLKSASVKFSTAASNPSVEIENGDGTHCHVLIVSGGCNVLNNHVRYWNDVCFAYNVFRRRGIPRTNIRVLWAGGDPESDLCVKNGYTCCQDDEGYRFGVTDLSDFDQDGNDDIDGAATRSNVENAFAEYASDLEADDQLIVFFTDHGGTYPKHNVKCNDQATLCLWRDSSSAQDLKDTELATLTAGIRCPVIMLLENCYSGGMMAEFLASAKNRVIATADAYDPSQGLLAIDNWVASFFGALDGYYPKGFDPVGIAALDVDAHNMSNFNSRQRGISVNADSDSDGRISIAEAHDRAVEDNFWTAALVATYSLSDDCEDQPQCEATEGGLSSRMFLTQYEDQKIVVRDRVATPTFGSADGTLGFSPARLTVTCPTAGATIRYTTDGSNPTVSTAVCGTDGVVVTKDCVVKVCAYKSGMDPSEIASLTCTIRKTPPEQPWISSVSQSDSTTGIVISWQNGDGTDHVDILRDTNESMSSATIIKSGLSAAETSYADMTAEPGQSYYYLIRAWNTYGGRDSDVSQEAVRALAAPSVTAALSGSAGLTSAKIRVSWTSVSGATHYRLYRNDATGAMTPVSGWIAAREFTDTVSYSNGGDSFAYGVRAAMDGTGRNAGDLSAIASISVVYDLSGASLVICHNSKDTEGLTTVAVKVGGKATTCYCKLKNADGTFEDEGFVSALTWTLVDGTGLKLTSKAGNYSDDAFSRYFGTSYTAPSVDILHQSGTGTCKLRASYTLGGKTVSRELTVVKTSDDVVRTLVISSPNFAVPGEVRELSAYCTLYGSSSWRDDIPAQSPVVWSILSGDGATLTDDGELTAWPVTKKTSVVVQAAVETQLGRVCAQQTVSISPSVITQMRAVIPPTGGESENYVGSIDTVTFGEWVDADWIDGVTYYGSSASGYNNKNITISLGKGRNQVAIGNNELYFSFRAERNAEKMRTGLFKLRWDGGGVDFTIEQQQAPIAATPNVSIASNGALAATDATDGSVLHYATDGEEPSDESPILDGEISFAADTPVAVKAFGEWMQESDTVYENLEGTSTRRTSVCVSFSSEMAGVSAPASREYKEGDVFGELPELSKSGVFFKGWALSKGSTKKVSVGDFVGSEDLTLYAIWSKIAADEPEWIAHPWNFSSSMSATFVVKVAGQTLAPSECTVGIEDALSDCRGSTKSGYGTVPDINTATDQHVFGIYSDVEDGETEELEIRVWHPDYGYLTVLNPVLNFEADSTLGTADEPYVINVLLEAEDPSGNLTFGAGKTSTFYLSSGERAVVSGVHGLRQRNFNGTDYFKATCFVDSRLSDPEKTKAENNDNYWCSPITEMNLLNMCGWLAFTDYADSEAVLDYFRKNPKLLWTTTVKNGEIVSQTLGKYAETGIVGWYQEVTGIDPSADEQYVTDGLRALLQEKIEAEGGAVGLFVYFENPTVNPKWKGIPVSHAVTCCGFAVDESLDEDDPESLKALYIIDSDNDQFTNSGAGTAPDSIIYCPVTWNAESEAYEVDGIWGESSILEPFAMTLGVVRGRKIAFDANGGKCDVSYLLFEEEDCYGNLPTPTRSGYAFNGWYTAKTDGDPVQEGDTVDFELLDSTKPTLYAHWLKEYTLTLKGTGVTAKYGDVTYTKSVSVPEGKSVVINADDSYTDSRDVTYRFQCWTPSKAYDFGDEYDAASSETTIVMPAAKLTVTATCVKESEVAWLAMYATAEAIGSGEATIEPDPRQFYWSVDGKAWFQNGTEALVKKGTYTIQWKSLDDVWAAPTTKNKVTVAAGDTYSNADDPAEFTFVYVVNVAAYVRQNDRNYESSDGGTATMTPSDGRILSGKAVTLKAKAARGYAFVGWQLDSETEGDIWSSSATLKLEDGYYLGALNEEDHKLHLQAVFRPISDYSQEDMYQTFQCVSYGNREAEPSYAAGDYSGSVEVRVGLNCLSEINFGCSSEAYPLAFKLTGTLPKGLKFDKTSGCISGTPTAAGTFPMVVTATDPAGHACSLSVSLVVRSVFDPIVGDWRALLKDGAGSYAGLVEMSITSKGKASAKVITATGTTSVTPTVSWTADKEDPEAEGTFDILYEKNTGNEKSGSYLCLKVASTEEYETEEAESTSGLFVYFGSVAWKNGKMTSSVDLSGDLVRMDSTKLSDDAFAASFLDKYYTLKLTADEGDRVDGYRTPSELMASGYLTVTTDKKKGTVKVAGKLPDGEKVSASTLLLPSANGSSASALVFVVPSGYKKKGSVALQLEFDSDGSVSSSVGEWVTPPLLDAISGWDSDEEIFLPGLLSLSASGAVYSKLDDLTNYYLSLAVSMSEPTPTLEYSYTDSDKTKCYERAEAVTDIEYFLSSASEPAMLTGGKNGKITVGRSASPWKDSEGYYHYDETKEDKKGNTQPIMNPGGITISFKSATGIFSGKFNLFFDYAIPQYDRNGYEKDPKLQHKSVSCPYEGVLVKDDGSTLGFGSAVYSGKYTYEYWTVDKQGNEKSATKTYTQKYALPVSWTLQ